ncbi:hypothetical protein [Arthrobacter sp. ISL-5]|uniref:hypothetical protein n=1 Tax=Arthrobacter sp. ISL-5 TaxID=2819111 RepID=UPI001BE93A20|nr:hypothetical protein [Arthrobacter sp. ISL-5]MBT2554174.1 hypothetical protein [Arthrobacter sp. ISL-5]
MSLDFSWCSLLAFDLRPRLSGGCFLFSGSLVCLLVRLGWRRFHFRVIVLFIGTG